MSRVPMTQAVAADYADAMLVARRAKNVLFFFLILLLLIQLGIFFLVRYAPAMHIRTETAATLNDSPATAPAVEVTTTGPMARWNWPRTLRFWITAGDFFAIVLSFVLPAILLLVVMIMLVGRLVGVSHVTSAFCWSIVFLVLLFPWQTVLSGHDREEINTASTTASTYLPVERPEITFPGVLYTFPELSRNYDFPISNFKTEWANIVLKWMRFVGWPVVEIIILLMVQARGSRGLRFALGEADVPVVTGTAV